MIESKTKHAAFDVLKCTECGAAIPVSQAIAAQVAEQTRQNVGGRGAAARATGHGGA